MVVSINGDGSTVAIGAERNDGTANNAGHVRIYDWSGTLGKKETTSMVKQPDFSSRSISISSDGNTLAIGAPGNDNAATWAGNVRIFEWSGTAWTQGASISGEAANDQSGHSVSISSDGNTIAIGAPYNDGSASNSGMFAFTNGVAPHGHNKDPISMVNLQTIKVVHLCRSVLMATPLQSVLHSMEEGGPNPAIQEFIVGTVQVGLKKGQTSMVKRPMIKAVMRYRSVLTEIP